MNSLARSSLAIALALAFPSCGSGGGGSAAGGMSIVSCSLVCTNSASNPESQVSCGVTDVYVNQAIRVTFNKDVDLRTVTNNSFRMIEVDTGKTPPAAFSLDTGDPRVLIYRPQLTFDSAGNPIFGLTAGKTYSLHILGTALDRPGPYIENTIGQPNTNRLGGTPGTCTLVASRGIFDANPGRPRVTVTVDQVADADGDGDIDQDDYDAEGNPLALELNQPANGACPVFRETDVRLVFDDVMNPGTLANPVTGVSEYIKVSVDTDGDTTGDDDQVDLQGTFTLTIDQNALVTTVVFRPAGGLPSAGTGSMCNGTGEAAPRKIVVELLTTIADLGGNLLVNPGKYIFTPERIDFLALEVTESFEDTVLEDSVRSGSPWADGRLGTGPGGGPGRLGDLIVPSNATIELDTDSEDFSSILDAAQFNPTNIIDRPDPFVVTGGVFEFSRLRVDAGGVLRFRGSKPARVYVRGEAVIQGLLDVSGLGGTLHMSTNPMGGDGGAGGPNAGAGGRGGNRPDGSAFTFVGGEANPGAGPTDVLDPATYDQVNGETGGGVVFPDTFDPSPTFVGKGEGGLAWPQPTAGAPDLHMPFEPVDVEGMEFDSFFSCRSPVPGAPGGGGAHGLSGGAGVALLTRFLATMPTLPPASPGGNSGELMIDDMVRSLSPELGLLRGGAGGGGGGAHLMYTQLNTSLLDCDVTIPPGSPKQVAEYNAHSSAGGGGGGGGIQVSAGRRIILNGVLDAAGGDGGSGTFPPEDPDVFDLAQAGGGGAGGGVLLQSQQIQIQAVPGRIKFEGGRGGEGAGDFVFPFPPSLGGNGAPGFLRLEATTAPNVAVEQGKVSPSEAELQAEYGPGAQIEELLTSAEWDPPAEGPSGFSGAQSCWIRPSGNFFQLLFAEDDAEPGWDMRLLVAGQAEPQSFRGTNDVFPGMTLEQVFGSDLGDAPVVVRFQGARATGTLIDPCSVPETGVSSPLAPGSLTDWVRHTAELNDFHGDTSLTPNIYRFVILWDRSHPSFSMIEGLEDLTVRIQPD